MKVITLIFLDVDGVLAHMGTVADFERGGVVVISFHRA